MSEDSCQLGDKHSEILVHSSFMCYHGIKCDTMGRDLKIIKKKIYLRSCVRNLALWFYAT